MYSHYSENIYPDLYMTSDYEIKESNMIVCS